MLELFNDLDKLGADEECPIGIIRTLMYQYYIVEVQHVKQTNVDARLERDIVGIGNIACKLIIPVPRRVVVGRIGELQRHTATG
jgi:hypothetical protein